MEKEILHSCEVNIEDEANDGWLYLENKLTTDEFETIFDQARNSGKAYFQDREGHHFTVEYKGGEFFLLKK